MEGQGGSITDPRALGPEALEGLLARLGPDPDAAALRDAEGGLPAF